MKKAIFTLLLLSFSSILFLGCSTHEEEQPSHRNDDNLWQQYRSDKAVKSLDEE